MNKGLNIIFKIIIFVIIVFVEEYSFYVTILSNVMTKRNVDMWCTFLIGSLVISAINIVAVYFFTKNVEVKLNNIVLLIISSVIVSICIVMLSQLFDKKLLMDVNYRKEVDYFTVLIFSALIDIWTSILALFLKIFIKLKH